MTRSNDFVGAKKVKKSKRNEWFEAKKIERHFSTRKQISRALQLLRLAANWVTFRWSIPMQQMRLGLKQKTQTENVIGVCDWNL